MIPVIRRIKNLAELGVKKDDLYNVYKQAFSRQPYFEYFPEGYLGEVIYRLECIINNPGGVCCVMFLNEKPIGVAGAYSLECEKEIFEILHESFPGIKPENIFYLAELAIGDGYLRKGYAKMLVAERERYIDRRQFTHILHRTHIDNFISQDLYQKFGFIQIPEKFQLVPTLVLKNFEVYLEKQKRIFSSRKI